MAKPAPHAPLPVTPCTGEDCTGRGPRHRPHPTFPCACGMWYATARGRLQHFAHAREVERASAEHREAQAALPRLRHLAEPHGLTVSLSSQGPRLDLLAPDGRYLLGNFCPAATETVIREYAEAHPAGPPPRPGGGTKKKD